MSARRPAPSLLSLSHTPGQAVSLPTEPPVQGPVSCPEPRPASSSLQGSRLSGLSQSHQEPLCGVGVLNSPPLADNCQMSCANKAWSGPRMCCQGNQAPSLLFPTSHSSLGSLCVCMWDCVSLCVSVWTVCVCMHTTVGFCTRVTTCIPYAHACMCMLV